MSLPKTITTDEWGHQSVNLKLVLMELGNLLVTAYGAHPQEDPRCVAIQQMMDMLNASLEARLILADLAVDWPVVEADWKKAVLKLGTEMRTIDLAEADKCEPSEDDWKEED